MLSPVYTVDGYNMLDSEGNQVYVNWIDLGDRTSIVTEMRQVTVIESRLVAVPMPPLQIVAVEIESRLAVIPVPPSRIVVVEQE